jgi:hypothetical protein
MSTSKKKKAKNKIVQIVTCPYCGQDFDIPYLEEK